MILLNGVSSKESLDEWRANHMEQDNAIEESPGIDTEANNP